MPPRFDLQAHRGGAGLAPENSLLAFDRALALGVTTLECDVHVSRDGVPVLSHERTYAGHVIPRRTWAELDGLRRQNVITEREYAEARTSVLRAG